MDKLKRDLADFNVHFDNWFSETSLYENGAIDNTLAKMKELGYTYEADGATWLRTSDFKDDKDRVLIKRMVTTLTLHLIQHTITTKLIVEMIS